jgi:hypothetical protein
MPAGRFSTYNFIKAEKGLIDESEISMETYYFNVECRPIKPILF